ncbi:MAG: right-handed parallel beta-helix repeat-containing protein [Microthrixaceae bacterium]
MGRVLQLTPDGTIDQIRRSIAQADPQPGDTIQLTAGSFYADFLLPAGVRLRGRGPDQTMIYSQGPAVGLESGSMLEDVCIQSDAGTSVIINEVQRPVISGCRFVGAGPDEVHVFVDNSADVVIRDCRFDGHAGHALRIRSSNCAVERCTINDQGRYLVLIETSTVRMSDSSINPVVEHTVSPPQLATADAACRIKDSVVHLERCSFACDRISAIEVDGQSALEIDACHFEWFAGGGRATVGVRLAAGITAKGSARVSVRSSRFLISEDDLAKERATSPAGACRRNGVILSGDAGLVVGGSRFQGISAAVMARYQPAAFEADGAAVSLGASVPTVTIQSCEFSALSDKQVDLYGRDVRMVGCRFGIIDREPISVVEGRALLRACTFAPCPAPPRPTSLDEIAELDGSPCYIDAKDSILDIDECSFARAGRGDRVLVCVEGGDLTVNGSEFGCGQATALMLVEPDTARVATSTFRWDVTVDPWFIVTVDDGAVEHELTSSGIGAFVGGAVEIAGSRFLVDQAAGLADEQGLNVVALNIMGAVRALVADCEFVDLGAALTLGNPPGLVEGELSPPEVSLQGGTVTAGSLTAVVSGGAALSAMSAQPTEAEDDFIILGEHSVVRIYDPTTQDLVKEVREP